jgi:hypothetical protein
MPPNADDVCPKLLDGDDLVERYAHRLARLAEQHLSPKVAGRLDAEDVVQSAFRTFFRRSVQGEFQIDSSAQMWRLLAKITLMKARAARAGGMRIGYVESQGPPASSWVAPVIRL